MLSIIKLQRRIGSDGTIDMIPVGRAECTRVISVIKWLVRGLYFHQIGGRLSPQLDWKVTGFEGVENERMYDELWEPGLSPTFEVGGSLKYQMMAVADHVEVTYWHLCLHESLFLVVNTNYEWFLTTHDAHTTQIAG
jgi:hypothetical protein